MACKKKTVTFNPIAPQCTGCDRVKGEVCSTYVDPPSMWLEGDCIMATHIKREAAAAERKLNPLKASKRASRGG